MDLLKESCKK